MSVFAVVPILPTLTSLFLLLPALLLSVLTAIASLRHPAVVGKVLRLVWRQKLALLLLAVGLAGMSWAGSVWSRWRTPHESSAEPSGLDWPMDRGSLVRRGWVPGAASPARAGHVWSDRRAGESFFASPAVVGRHVYCVGSRGDSARIICWDIETGQRLWSAAPPDYRATFSSPVVCGAYLLCGEGLHHTRMARVVCLDLRPPRAGRIAWSFQTNSHVECTPVVDGDRVYFGAGDDGIYCLRLDPRVPEEQRVVWHVAGSRYPDAETSLAVCEGKVYVGLGLGGNALCVLDADTGAERARIPLPFPVFSPAAIAGGKLFVGMGQGDYVRPVDDPAGSICCIDLDTLRLEWSFATPATVLGAVVVAGEQLVVGCADGWVYVLDRQGRMLRRWDSRWPIVAAPCVTEDLVVVVNQGGWLHALDRRWLQPVWELRLGQPGRYFSSPVVASGRVLIGTERDGFHCLGTPDGEDRPAIWPAPWGGAGRAGCRDGSHVPPEAAVLWEWSRLRETGMPVTVTAPAAAAGDAVVAGFAAVGNEFGLACLAADGSRPQVRWTRRVPRPIGSSPVIAGGAVAVISGSAGDAERQMLVFDLGSGTSLWSLPLETTGDTVCSATPERLFVQESDDTLSCRTLDGQLVWRQAVGRLSHAADVSDDLLVAATASPPALLALDAVTGRRLWTCSLDRLATTAPAVRGSRIYFADRAGVQARSLLDGRGIWQSAGEVSGPLYVDRERFAYVSSAGELVLGAADTGAELSRLSTEATGGSNPLVAGNAVLWQGLRTMLAADLSGRNVRPFAVWEAGEPTAAAILHAGRVYLGIAGRGLVCLGGDGEP